VCARLQEWTTDTALAFLSLCRAHKPLLAAQRPHATLTAVLDVLARSAPACSSAQLATALLDMAFIGCQSFKSHEALDAVNATLYERIASGELGPESALELADAVRALDKLDHCHAGLSAAAGARWASKRAFAICVMLLLAAFRAHAARPGRGAAGECVVGRRPHLFLKWPHLCVAPA
jgi:hypothetical protein